MRSRKGFTLVELLVVIIIVGVLASVAIPLMTGYVNRAKKSEAVAALGTIRSAERAYNSENTAYKAITSGDNLSNIGIKQSDLDGRYFSNKCYSVDGTSGLITCNANSSTSAAPNYTEVTTFGTMTMDSNGTLAGNYT